MTLKTSAICSILICFSSILNSATARFVDKKPLHHRMTDKEIRHYFGVEKRSNVPAYEVTAPFESNENGHFVSYSLESRRKRSVNDGGGNNDIHHYKFDAFGKQLRLHVKRTTKFIARGLQLEKWGENGQVTKTPVSTETYFTGQDASDPGSFVTLSVRDGLTGMIRGSCDTYHVHPLPSHLVQPEEAGARPHLVYKTTGQQKRVCQSNTSQTSFVERRDASSIGSSPQNGDEVPEKYLEAALVADEEVAEFHGDLIEEFLLLIASTIDRIFQDQTIGDIKINYVVTRLVVISNQELGIQSTNSSVSGIDVLHKLASWAKENNKDSDSDPEQFDVTSMIRSVGSGGVTILGGMCYQNPGNGARKKDVVNLNHDIGFQTAYTIVHETSHNFGLGHDGGECPDLVNIMSSVLVDGPHSLEWSTCSSDRIQQFLTNPDLTCLDDPPTQPRPQFRYSFYNNLPGQFVDADEQCRAQYSSLEYWRCPQRESYCDSLYCTNDGLSCYSRYVRPLEGTPCGSRKWCIGGFCVDDGTGLPPKIDGRWGEWSEYTQCTPPCGGGVRYRTRTCTNPPPQNGGAYCVGSSTGFREICNAEVECGSSSPSFRDVQCAEKNNGSQAYYPNGGNPCNLACRKGGFWRYYGDVISGTRCYNDRTVYDVCIEGQCRAVGCDKILESGKMKDRCGVCNGNGDTCTLVSSSYTEDYRTYYEYGPPDIIVELPSNSSYARFHERNKSWNLIGVQDEIGTYLIPVPSWGNRVVYAAGTKISYFNSNRFADRLEIEGPTNMILVVVFAYTGQESNVGIDYEYYRPLQPGEEAVTPVCHWNTTSWTDCSTETGEQSREVICARSENEVLSPASDECCDLQVRPDSARRCYWSTEWHASDWTTCSKTCGQGSQSRTVVCRSKLNATHYEINPDSMCDNTAKPISFTLCNEIYCPAQWKVSSWSQCSTVCLPGERTRDVKCTRTNEVGEEEDVAAIRCEYEPKPPTKETCNTENPCKELAIGCFRTPAGTLFQITEFTEQDPDYVIAACGELAYHLDFRVFAIGGQGQCYSEAGAEYTYHVNGNVPKSKCPNGVGKESASYVYSFEPMPEVEALGCFKDKVKSRALPDLYANFRSYIDWNNMDLTIRQCALVARHKHYDYFAVQYYGECFSSHNATEGEYSQYGEETDSVKCPTWLADVGGPRTNFVYKFLPLK